ncbi:hypothetical protein TNIN_222731 [Trichonephila inaurata madagascariensis]|uniref:Uncharacterized protein n=1 Tax=Trichonephila inaurata madagascariensis TaxID=2747483 RepID=A0A8X7BXD0_9ARAC|nr:hypothetical protein TNIN_222731 [Trichonephila inaurata madagascariensis]
MRNQLISPTGHKEGQTPFTTKHSLEQQNHFEVVCNPFSLSFRWRVVVYARGSDPIASAESESLMERFGWTINKPPGPTLETGLDLFCVP